jgi:hypothetical protein
MQWTENIFAPTFAIRMMVILLYIKQNPKFVTFLHSCEQAANLYFLTEPSYFCLRNNDIRYEMLRK